MAFIIKEAGDLIGKLDPLWHIKLIIHPLWNIFGIGKKPIIQSSDFLDTTNNPIPRTDNTTGIIQENVFAPARSRDVVSIELEIPPTTPPPPPPNGGPMIGGEYSTIDSTTLLVSGMQASISWMIPIALSMAGVTAILVRWKF